MMPCRTWRACLAFAPLYVWQVARREKNPAWREQAVIATVAFAIWAYAVDGALFESGRLISHNPTVAGILLILFSMGIALYQPKAVVR